MDPIEETLEETPPTKLTPNLALTPNLTPNTVSRPVHVKTCPMCSESSACPTCCVHMQAAVALQVVIVFVVTVVLQTIAVHYTLAKQHGFQYQLMVQADVLRVLGSLWVDITALYFMVHGYRIGTWMEATGTAVAGEGTTHGLVDSAMRRETHADTMRRFLPDIVLSCIPYVVMQFTVTGSSLWTWLWLAAAPFLLSSFFDIRVSNGFRPVNESLWLAQLTALYALLGFAVHGYVKRVCVSLGLDANWNWLFYTTMFSWAMGFLHLYVAFQAPAVASSITRSVFTNMIFFVTGVFIAMVPYDGQLRGRLQSLQQWMNTSFFGLLFGSSAGTPCTFMVLFMVFFYVHHVQNTTETANCVTVFGGTPCLWYVDICNLRMYPIYAWFLLWYTDTSSLFPVSLAGSITSPLVDTFKHVSHWIASWDDYSLAFIVYSESIALAVGFIVMSLMPTWAVEFSVLFILGEILVVTWACVWIRTFVTPLAVRCYDVCLSHPFVQRFSDAVLRCIPTS